MPATKRGPAVTSARPSRHATPEHAQFREFYREHHDFVWRCARRLGAPLAAVDDVVQDVFLAAHRHSDRFLGRASWKTWLFGIAANVVRMHQRSQFRHDRKLEAVLHVPREPSVDEAERHAALDLLDRLLATLDDDKRTVFILVQLEDVDPRDVAAMVGVPVNTVYSRLRLARARLDAAVQRHQARSRRAP